MKRSVRFPEKRMVEIIEGDLEFEMEISDADYSRLYEIWRDTDHQPIVKLKVTCDSKDKDDVATFVLTNWVLHE